MLSQNGLNWLYALVVSLILSLCGLVVPNALRQSRKKRAHNTLKLWNEMLARHQLGYFTFYLAIGLTSPVVSGFNNRILAIPLALTILFYIGGVIRSTHVQDHFLTENHKCPDDDSCRVRLPKWTAFRLLWPNAAMAMILALFAW